MEIKVRGYGKTFDNYNKLIQRDYISKDKIRKLLNYHKEQIKLVGSHEYYNQELGYIEALEELLK